MAKFCIVKVTSCAPGATQPEKIQRRLCSQHVTFQFPFPVKICSFPRHLIAPSNLYTCASSCHMICHAFLQESFVESAQTCAVVSGF